LGYDHLRSPRSINIHLGARPKKDGSVRHTKTRYHKMTQVVQPCLILTKRTSCSPVRSNRIITLIGGSEETYLIGARASDPE